MLLKLWWILGLGFVVLDSLIGGIELGVLREGLIGIVGDG